MPMPQAEWLAALAPEQYIFGYFNSEKLVAYFNVIQLIHMKESNYQGAGVGQEGSTAGYACIPY